MVGAKFGPENPMDSRDNIIAFGGEYDRKQCFRLISQIVMHGWIALMR